MTARSVPSSAWYVPQPRPGDLVAAVVERAQDAVGRLEIWIDLALVPDVVAGRDDVDPRREDRIRGGRRQAHPTRDVLAVGGHEVDAALVAQRRQEALHRHPPGLADHVADHQHAAGA
jgi:hypothetical protein